jgi:hypothetical protein
VIHEILVSEGEAEDALGGELQDAVLDEREETVVAKALREPGNDPGLLLRETKEDGPSVRRDLLAAEISHDGAATEGSQS